jgi:hypothetical protein
MRKISLVEQKNTPAQAAKEGCCICQSIERHGAADALSISPSQLLQRPNTEKT